MDIQLFATDEELQVFPENKTDSSTVQDKTPNTKSINLAVSDLPRLHTLTCLKFPLSYLSINLDIDPEKATNTNLALRTLLGVGKQIQLRTLWIVRPVQSKKYPIVGWQLAQAKNPIVDCLAAQTNDQLDTKQEIQWIGKPIRETYLDQLVSPSEAALPSQPALGPPEIAPPVAHQLEARQPVLHLPMVRPPMLHLLVAHQLAFPQPMVSSAQSSCSPAVVPSSPGPTWTRSLEPSHPRHYGTSSSVSRSARTY